MPRKTIAPLTEAWLRDGVDVPSEAMGKEVRALLAVARAALAVQDGVRSDFADEDRLDRALARLSGAGRKGR